MHGCLDLLDHPALKKIEFLVSGSHPLFSCGLLIILSWYHVHLWCALQTINNKFNKHIEHGGFEPRTKNPGSIRYHLVVSFDAEHEMGSLLVVLGCYHDFRFLPVFEHQYLADLKVTLQNLEALVRYVRVARLIMS
jgi:hypothetical protein